MWERFSFFLRSKGLSYVCTNPDRYAIIKDGLKEYNTENGTSYSVVETCVQIINQKGIHTIGDLAVQPKERIQALLGKGGEMLWQYANGLDTEKVRQWGDKPEIKSVSRGMTFKRDLVKKEETTAGISALVDEIAASLRHHQLKGSVISVQIKSPDLRVISRQTSLDHATYLQHEIQKIAMDLIESNWRIGESAPIRALTVGVTKLIPRGGRSGTGQPVRHDGRRSAKEKTGEAG